MTNPLTMTAEREAEIRKLYGGAPSPEFSGTQLFAEIDALRAALAESHALRTATLAHFDNVFGAEMHSMLGLIERDSAMKQETRELRQQLAESREVAKALAEALSMSDLLSHDAIDTKRVALTKWEETIK